MTTTANESFKALYQRGVTDGMEVALRLLLGREAEGGVPFAGPLTVETFEWASAALTAVEATKEAR